MKTFLISVFFILTISSCGQQFNKVESFNRGDYPTEKFQITTDSCIFYNMLIETHQVRSLARNDPGSCRAWLTISKNGKSIYQRFFNNIKGGSGCFGIFIPIWQPREDYFIISKLGDFDNKIFIIDSLGKVTEKFGGGIYVSKDKRYLFSHSNPFGPKLTVFDFSKGSCIFSDSIKPALGAWFFQDKKYISPIYQDRNGFAVGTYAIFDFTNNKLIISKDNDFIPDPMNRLPNYSDQDNRIDCFCGLERFKNRK